MKKLVRESLNESSNDVKYSQLFRKVESHKHDDSMFSINLSDGDVACAMGDEFNPEEFNMTLEEMLQFIDQGLNYFANFPDGTLDADDLSEWHDFFTSELYDEPETDDGERVPLTKEYVIAKLICGIQNAKSAGV